MKVQDTIKLAKKHSIRRDVASPDFFEGAIMGNGDLGLIVCTRPDALLMHLGHNNIWDIDFLSRYDYKNQLLSEEVYFEVKDIKFIDFEYLNTFFYNFKREKTVSSRDDFDIHNIRNDFFLLVETKEIAFVAGGNYMDFFTPSERLDDASLRELSNQWMLYFLNYHMKRNLIKDPMCENHPLMHTKK
ncbi:hypothetical protein [uncultured Methanobrevibacter sp.]|uniref:hypothetical protein n=1 Tax=uncultured Methanobrevibacter sp. TaxID=253161 RepID=UPI00258A1D8E|nr:hypothetical protein [uncultured Methanobrevibacter sp.]